jgi:hypothetical protein
VRQDIKGYAAREVKLIKEKHTARNARIEIKDNKNKD